MSTNPAVGAVDPAEVAKFDAAAHRFWDERGEFRLVEARVGNHGVVPIEHLPIAVPGPVGSRQRCIHSGLGQPVAPGDAHQQQRSADEDDRARRTF
jgi:hypothetical protein